jgi:DNA-binding GntR family transcriptional regulator
MMVPLKRSTIQRQTVTEQVHRHLKQAIIEGEFQPGDRLVEVEIAARLGASRTPVREALSKLEQEGLVTPVRFGGLAVAQLSEVDVVEIFSLIKLLESYAGRLAAERATDKQLAKLEQLCKRAEQLPDIDTERLAELNQQFHEQVVEAAGHKRLRELIMTLRTSLRPYRLVSLESSEFRKKCVLDHRALVDAVRARKGEQVEQMMFAHLNIAEQVALDRMRESSKAALCGPTSSRSSSDRQDDPHSP